MVRIPESPPTPPPSPDLSSLVRRKDKRPCDFNEITVIDAPFFRQGDNKAFHQVRPYAELAPIVERDMKECSAFIEHIDKYHRTQTPTFIAVNAERIVPIKSNGLTSENLHFFSHHATVITSNPEHPNQPTVGLYQAIVQLIPRPNSHSWGGSRVVKSWEVDSEEDEWCGDDEMEAEDARVLCPVDQNARNGTTSAPHSDSLDIPDLSPHEIPATKVFLPDIGRLSLTDHGTFKQLTTNQLPQLQYPDDMEALEEFVGVAAISDKEIQEAVNGTDWQDLGNDLRGPPQSPRAIATPIPGRPPTPFPGQTLGPDFPPLGAAQNPPLLHAPMPSSSDACKFILFQHLPPEPADFSDMLRRIHKEHHQYEEAIAKAYLEDLDELCINTSVLRQELLHPKAPIEPNLFVNRFLDPWFKSEIGPSPTRESGILACQFYPIPSVRGPVLTVDHLDMQANRTRPVVFPEDLLPDVLITRLCYASGFGLDVPERDTELWNRIVHLFLLRMAEEICNRLGRIPWLEEQSEFKSANPSPTLLTYADPIHFELNSYTGSNVSLYPAEREACRQCYIFLSKLGHPPPFSDQEAAFITCCLLLTYSAPDAFSAHHANNRRISGELGPPGGYPYAVQEYLDRFKEERSVAFRSESLDTFHYYEDLPESPDSY